MEKNRLIVPLIFLVVIIILFRGISETRAAYDNEPTLHVLMLHVVCEEMPEDKSLHDLYITTERLDEYCRYFSQSNYQIVSLEEAYRIFSGKQSAEKADLLAFTFDDGYDNNYSLAYPILKKYGVKANINVIAKYIDDELKVWESNYMTWEQLKEMQDSGLIEIGSHTYNSHDYVIDDKGKWVPQLKAKLPGETDEMRKNRIFEDLEKADKLIEENLGEKTRILAYPYGVPPTDLMGEIIEKFEYPIGMLVTEGVNHKLEDFSKLKRFTVSGNESAEKLDRRMQSYKGTEFFNK